MALSKDEETAFREWLAERNAPEADEEETDDTPEADADEETDDTPETDDEDDEDEDDPGVTLKAGGVLIYRGRTYQRVKDTPRKRAPARKRSGGSSGAPPRAKSAPAKSAPRVPKVPVKDPAPGGGSKRQLFT